MPACCPRPHRSMFDSSLAVHLLTPLTCSPLQADGMRRSGRLIDGGRRSARKSYATKQYDPEEEAAKPQWGSAVAHLVVEDRRWKRKSPVSRSSAVELDVTEIIGDADRRSARRFCAPSRYDPAREASKPQWDTGQMTAVDEPRIGDTDAVHAAADATAAGAGRYDVERLLQQRNRGGHIEYLVKWLDYDDGHNTWEPTANICAESLAAFEAQRSRDKSPTARSSAADTDVAEIVGDAESLAIFEQPRKKQARVPCVEEGTSSQSARQLGSAIVDVQQCTSDTAVFAAAMGLLQPARGSPKGLLSGCNPIGWSAVRRLREASAALQPLAESEPVDKHANRRWTECKIADQAAEQVAVDTAHSMDRHLAYAVGVHAPHEVMLDRVTSNATWHRHPWAHVALLVADLVHAHVSALLPEASAVALMTMIEGCELSSRKMQTRAEKYLEGVGAWRSIPKQSEPVIKLGTIFKDRSSLAAFAATCAKWWADIRSRYRAGDPSAADAVSVASNAALEQHTAVSVASNATLQQCTVELDTTVLPEGCSGFVCPVCDKTVDGQHRYQDKYARYEACAECKHATGPDVVAGDLLKLAQTSPASIVGAGRLAHYAHELKSGNQLTDGHYEALLTRAKQAISDHMHVQDADKVMLADRYETEIQYKGHCCAVCGVRDVELDYTEVYFDRSGNKSTGTVNTAAGLRVRSKKRAVQLRALPDWLRVENIRVTELQSNTRFVYVEHDDAPGRFVKTQISALDMRHIMRVCGDSCRCDKCYVHLIEEAMDMTSPDGVALMFVCAHCVTALPSASTRKQKRATNSTTVDSATASISASTTVTAADSVTPAAAAAPRSSSLDDDKVDATRKDPRPIHSMAKRDYGRRYLPAAAVDQLGLERRARTATTTESSDDGASGDTLHRDELLHLSKLRASGWRLPIASRMETMLLAKAYVHIMSLKIAEGKKGGSHAALTRHTVYFPLSLLDAQDKTRQVKPWQEEGDAADALRIAVQKLQVIFVGPDGKFEQKRRALLSMEQMQMRPKVVFTLLALQSMDAQEKSVTSGDAYDGTAHTIELALLEKELSRGVLEACITPESVSVPPNDKNQAVTVDDHDHASVRSDRGCADRNCDHTDDSSAAGNGNACVGQRHPLPHEKYDEEEPIAGCADISNSERDVMLGAARLLQRGMEPIDDYDGQPQVLYDAHYPLFPIQEGLELGKKLSVRKTRHMSLFYDCRFAQDLSLIFELADTLSRHAVNSAVSFSAKNNPYAQKQLEELIRDGELKKTLRRVCLDPRGAEAVALLNKILPFVRMSARRAPYTDGSRKAFLGTLFAHHRCMGPASHFVSIAPEDVRDLRTIRDSRPFRRIFQFPHVRNATDLGPHVRQLREGKNQYAPQALWRGVVKNPVAATIQFHHKIKVLNRVLLGIDPTLKQTSPFQARPKGVLGRFRAAAFVKECNNRGSQHIHMLTFGSVVPAFLTMVSSVPDLRQQVVAALDTQVSARLPWTHHVIDRLRQMLRLRKAPLAIAGNGACNDAGGARRGLSAGQAARDRRPSSPEMRPRKQARARSQVAGCIWDRTNECWVATNAPLGPSVQQSAGDPAQERPHVQQKLKRLQERANMIVMNHNRHQSHCFSCRKGKRGKDGCRFMIPFPHGIDRTRCIQLKKRDPNEPDDIQPDDVRWCKACVVGTRAQATPFTDGEKQHIRRRIIDRGLHYKQVDVQPLPQLSPVSSAKEAFERLTAPDARCLVVEVARPCPPDGQPLSIPTKPEEVLDLLRKQLDAEEALHTASFSLSEVEERLGTEAGAEWLLEQCTAAHCDNGVVAEYCAVLSAMLECNTAIYHLGAGTNAKAASTYFCKYQVKPQYDLNYDMLVVISTAMEDIRRKPSRADDTGTPGRTTKHLAQRIINTGAERSATEAAMICLGQKAEEAEDTNTYVNAWDLCAEACKLAGVPCLSAPDEQGQTDDDTRERNNLMGDTGHRGVSSARKYCVNKEIKWVTTAQHYMFRSVKLRHLNAMEFFQLYDVKARAKSAQSSSAAADTAECVQRDGRGRKRQPSYRFLSEHPLSASHECVLRAKVMLPLLTGGSPPPRPKVSKKFPSHSTWSKYYSSLFVPWGSVDEDGDGTNSHFKPVVSMAEFVGWWLSLQTESIRYAHDVALKDSAVATPARRSARQFREQCTVPTFVDPAGWQGYFEPLGEGLRDDRRRRFLRDILEYRLFLLENTVGAFDAKQSAVNLANSHRGQSRTVWNDKNRPQEDRTAWGDDDIFDMLRVAKLDREIRECRTDGKYLRKALNVAASNESLRKCVFDKLGTIHAPSRGPSIKDASWCGSKAPSGFEVAACTKAYQELQRPVTNQERERSCGARVDRSPSAPNPFADVIDEHDQSDDDIVLLHENQRAVGRNFLACLRARGTVAGEGVHAAPVSLCIGPAGSGKSTMIHALLAQIASERLGHVVVTGYTGVSCTPFLSPSLLMMCNIPARDMSDEDPDAVVLQRFKDRFVQLTGIRVDDLAGLIIDEVSFLKPEVLGRVSRLFEFARGRRGQPFGGLPVLLAGHLSQLPPVGAAGTWFVDILNEERRMRGDSGLGDRVPRELTRNFKAGLTALRDATRYDLTHNYRADDDPEFAECLLNLCNPARDTPKSYMVSYLQKLKEYDPREELTKFGPFATLSNAMRHAINRQKILEYGKHHRLPVIRWRWETTTKTHIPDDVYATEPSLWGYFCEGAPVQITLSSNPAKGVANGTCGNMMALQFSNTPDVVRVVLEQSGRYDGSLDDPDGFVTLVQHKPDRIVIRVSGATWHGVELPQNVKSVLPTLAMPRRSGIDTAGCVALPLQHKQSKEGRLTGTQAAYSGVSRIMKRPATYELAFALTDYKLQGMTLERLVVLIGQYPYPVRHSLSSLYVMLSRVRRSTQLRILQGQRGSIEGLVGKSMQQRDELVVFEDSYDRRHKYNAKLALRAYDTLLAQRAAR
eukprot:COSAG01_NODE_76_length_28332_cov_298.876992_15_plen_2949_part_00